MPCRKSCKFTVNERITRHGKTQETPDDKQRAPDVLAPANLHPDLAANVLPDRHIGPNNTPLSHAYSDRNLGSYGDPDVQVEKRVCPFKEEKIAAVGPLVLVR
jgi:hypothetical protein